MVTDTPRSIYDSIFGGDPEVRADNVRSQIKRRDAITALISIATLLLVLYGLTALVLLIRWSWTW